MQLEEEYEDKQKVLREKRELESKLSAVSDQVGHGDTQVPWGGHHSTVPGTAFSLCRPTRGTSRRRSACAAT